MGYLYINAKGQPWRRHSYSAGNTWEQCPYKYYLQKILGWREKDNRARFELGKAFESAIQWYHENRGDRDGAIKHFLEKWQPALENKEMNYTRVERDWHTCARIGTDWLKLYHIRQPKLPIPLGGMSLFQREFRKEVFPGDPIYGEIEDTGKIDIIAYVEPDHPLLPKLEWQPEYGAYRPLIVDVKTSGADFPETYGLAAYDTQLRRYSWLSNIRDVAFLWFVKKALKVQKGYSVTLLEDAGNGSGVALGAGVEAVVAGTEDQGCWLLSNDFMVEEMERIQGKKADGKTDQTNAAKARRDAWLKENGVWVSYDQITKQRMQFNAGFVTTDSADDAGLIAQKQIVEIVNAQKTGYPNKFSVRYPKNDLSDPYMRAFVLNDKMYREQNFYKTDEDADLFADDDNEAPDDERG